MGEYREGECVVFCKVNEPFGGLSNMAGGFPLDVDGRPVRFSEALYQACRFPHRPDWQAEILAEASPMAAKMKSKKEGRRRDHSRPDWEAIQVDVMRWCLRVKLARNPARFGALLLASRERPIVERSRKDAFWGAVPVTREEGLLRGENRLGRLLDELREEWRTLGREGLRAVTPPPVAGFLLLGREVGFVEVG